MVAERFDGVEYCTFFMGKLILPVDRSWRVIPQNDRQSAKIIICKLESVPIQFGNLVAWKPQKNANFSIFRVANDCRKQRNVDEMRLKVPICIYTHSLSFKGTLKCNWYELNAKSGGRKIKRS